MTAATVLIVPGLRDHVAEHWQTLLAARLPKAVSVPPLTTDKLSLKARVAAISAAANSIEGPVVICAHSAGVVMTAHWAMSPSRPIKAALLDQKIVAGLGNIYVCEALYYSGISPRRSAHTVQGARAERLATAIRQVLDKALKAGGSSLRDYVQTSGELGYFQHQFSVYGREGEACPKCDCNKTVERILQSGRSTFYCAACQR